MTLSQENTPELSHLNNQGEANMVDVTDKNSTVRIATAQGTISMNSVTLAAIQDNSNKKGDVIATARIAGIQAAKKCADLIFVKPRFNRYKEVSEIIRSIFFEYSDLVEPLSLDEAFIDVTINKKEMESANDIAREIRQKIFEKTPRNNQTILQNYI